MRVAQVAAIVFYMQLIMCMLLLGSNTFMNMASSLNCCALRTLLSEIPGRHVRMFHCLLISFKSENNVEDLLSRLLSRSGKTLTIGRSSNGCLPLRVNIADI